MTHTTPRKSSNRRSRKVETLRGPRAATIEAILGYSKALQVVHAPPVGRLALLLN
jgi:hypothetical protein